MEADDPRLLDLKTRLETALKVVEGEVLDQMLMVNTHSIISHTMDKWKKDTFPEGDEDWKRVEVTARPRAEALEVNIRHQPPPDFTDPTFWTGLSIRSTNEDPD